MKSKAAAPRPRHGVLSTYTNGKCRCDKCKAAMAAYSRQRRDRNVERGLPPGDPRHGTLYGYQAFGCKCAACTAANTADKRERATQLRSDLDSARHALERIATVLDETEVSGPPDAQAALQRLIGRIRAVMGVA